MGESDYLDVLLDHAVAGIVIISGTHADTSADHARYLDLAARGVPTVLVNGTPVVTAPLQDGDLVSIAVSARSPQGGGACENDRGQRCVDLPTEVGSAGLQLRWTEEAPEEDPGGVAVVLLRDSGETASIGYAGPAITGDPRELDLPIGVDTLVDVVEDPRLRYQATSETLALGEELDDWEGGEPDPDAYELVRNTDHGIAQAYVGGRGGYGYYEGVIRSPLRGEFGPDAIGGRLLQRSSPGFTGVPDADIDVLAAPSPPAWMTREPCSSSELRKHCVTTKGRRGPLVFAWQPAKGDDVGWAWMISMRSNEVVAVRYQGSRMPAGYEDAAMLAEWYQGEQLDSESGEAESALPEPLSSIAWEDLQSVICFFRSKGRRAIGTPLLLFQLMKIDG
jgi:hypothetical protein